MHALSLVLTSVHTHLLAASPSPSPGSGTTKSSFNPTSLIFLVVIIAGGYFLLIRPNKRRQQAAAQMRSTVAPGAEVVTTAGLYATVVAVDDDGVTLEIAPGVHSRFRSQAIMQVLTPVAEPDGTTEPSALDGSHERIDPDDTPPATADEA